MPLAGSHERSQLNALKAFFDALNKLHQEKVLINKKDFTCQLGEWLVEVLFNGKRAVSGIQRGWDVEVNGRFIQVKAHAKANGNNNRWSAVERCTDVKVDELIIVVFTNDYKLKHFIQVPWQHAVSFITERGIKKKRCEINWSCLEVYFQDISTLPRQDIISLFQ